MKNKKQETSFEKGFKFTTGALTAIVALGILSILLKAILLVTSIIVGLIIFVLACAGAYFIAKKVKC